MSTSLPRVPVLAVAPLSPLFLNNLAKNYHVLGPLDITELQTHPLRGEIAVVVGGGESRIPAELMQLLPALQLISIMGVGYDGVDIGYAVQHGIAVTHTPNVLNDDVADLALALMLNVTRKIPQADKHVRSGGWSQGPVPLATKFSGLRLGLVGMGRIGQAIAKRALAFSLSVAYTARSSKPDLPYAFVADIEQLAAQVDVLCVITPGGRATHHLINARILKALGPKGYLVNVARGSVVDEFALVHALENGLIAGAGLDVFENEPHPQAALLASDKVVLTPHIGSATDFTRAAMADLATRNVLLWSAKKPLESPVPECQSVAYAARG